MEKYFQACLRGVAVYQRQDPLVGRVYEYRDMHGYHPGRGLVQVNRTNNNHSVPAFVVGVQEDATVNVRYAWQNCRLRMRWECLERFPRHWLQRKLLVSDPGIHHITCVAHLPWCMSGSLTRGGGGNVPGIPGACATRNFTYLVRGPWKRFPDYWAFVRGPTTKDQQSGALIFSLMLACISCWTNNRFGDDFSGYDVTLD